MIYNAIAALVMFVGQSISIPTITIDLTRDRTVSERTNRYPGGSGGFPDPLLHYRLPLSILAADIQTEVSDPEYLRCVITLVNTDTRSFLMPSSLDTVAVQSDGNVGRRTFQFGLELQKDGNSRQDGLVMQVADGSNSVPSSLLMMHPQQRAIIKLRIPANTLSVINGKPSSKLRVTLSEIKIKDRAFVTIATSEPVTAELICRADPSIHCK